MDSWLLHLLVKNLNDSDTRQELMSKVKDMDLNDTIAFVEAKETSRKAHTSLEGGMASSSIHEVWQPSRQADHNSAGLLADPRKCNACGSKDHKNGYHIRRKNCPAFKHTCTNCKQLGHFSDKARQARKCDNFDSLKIKQNIMHCSLQSNENLVLLCCTNVIINGVTICSEIYMKHKI